VKKVMTTLLSPSLLRYKKRKKKGDRNNVAVAFFGALQTNKKKKATATTLSPSLFRYNKTKKEDIREETYLKLLLWFPRGSCSRSCMGPALAPTLDPAWVSF
jgi:hypothetical protein